jgi:hypothetical protein
MPTVKELFVRQGYYTADRLADLLVRGADSSREAKKALTRALNKKHPKQAIVLYAAAYLNQQKTGCADITALRRTAGKRWRSLYDKLLEHGVTLEQLVKNSPDKF